MIYPTSGTDEDSDGGPQWRSVASDKPLTKPLPQWCEPLLLDTAINITLFSMFWIISGAGKR